MTSSRYNGHLRVLWQSFQDKCWKVKSVPVASTGSFAGRLKEVNSRWSLFSRALIQDALLRFLVRPTII